jgi:chromosome segregation ATPase
MCGCLCVCPTTPTLVASIINAMAVNQTPESAFDSVENIVRAMKDLTNDDNYKLVTEVFREFLAVKQQNNRLRLSEREMLEEYRKFKNDLEQNEAIWLREKELLEGSIKDKINGLADLADAHRKMEADIQSTNDRLDEHLRKVEQATSEVAKLEKEKKQLENHKVKAAAHEVKWAKKIESFKDEISTLEQDIRVAKAVAHASKQEKEALKGRNANLEKENITASEAASKKIETLTAANTSLEDQQKSVEAAALASVDILRKQLQDDNNRYIFLENKKLELEASARVTAFGLVTLRLLVEKTTAKIAETTKKLDDAISHVKAMSAGFSALEAQLKATGAELGTQNKRLEDIGRCSIKLENEPEDN